MAKKCSSKLRSATLKRTRLKTGLFGTTSDLKAFRKGSKIKSKKLFYVYRNFGQLKKGLKVTSGIYAKGIQATSNEFTLNEVAKVAINVKHVLKAPAPANTAAVKKFYESLKKRGLKSKKPSALSRWAKKNGYEAIEYPRTTTSLRVVGKDCTILDYNKIMVEHSLLANQMKTGVAGKVKFKTPWKSVKKFDNDVKKYFTKQKLPKNPRKAEQYIFKIGNKLGIPTESLQDIKDYIDSWIFVKGRWNADSQYLMALQNEVYGNSWSKNLQKSFLSQVKKKFNESGLEGVYYNKLALRLYNHASMTAFSRDFPKGTTLYRGIGGSQSIKAAKEYMRKGKVTCKMYPMSSWSLSKSVPWEFGDTRLMKENVTSKDVSLYYNVGKGWMRWQKEVITFSKRGKETFTKLSTQEIIL